jgi:tRNA A-37 threonylcarbamoyl transferase component Bud32
VVEKKSESYFEQKMENAERIEEGYNEHVYDTGDTIIEYYPWISSTAPRQSVTEFFLGKFRVFTRRRRMENELLGAEIIESIGLNSSEPVSVGERFIEFEKIQGENIRNFDMEKMGLQVGEFMKELHAEDAALMDGTLSNFLYSEEEGLYSIDHDSFRQDANSREIKFDLINTLTSVIVENPDEYSGFKKGIKEGYGELTRKDELLLGINTFLFNLISHDLRFLKNSLRNYREHHI